MGTPRTPRDMEQEKELSLRAHESFKTPPIEATVVPY